MLSFLTQGYHQCINSRLPTFIFFFSSFLLLLLLLLFQFIVHFKLGVHKLIQVEFVLNLDSTWSLKEEAKLNLSLTRNERQFTETKLSWGWGGPCPPTHPPPPPSPRLAFEKFTFSIYIYTQNFTVVPKIIYFTPSLKKITSWTMKSQKWKFIKFNLFI